MADNEKKALIGTGIESVPKGTPEIGIDTDEHFADTIIDVNHGTLNLCDIVPFSLMMIPF